MLANDNLTYSYQKRTAPKSAERALITVERSQKLDLLVHLLSNLQQSLVVCGPQGIGKTTLLQTLQETCGDVWHFVRLAGSSALSFEAIMQQLSRALNLSGSGVDFDLSALRAFCGKQKVALIIDDAGDLVPGLIGELTSFAESLAGLRVVVAMTYDEFHIKSATDHALEECHVIELPPLNRKQTLEYLQNLSAQPSANLSFNAITDELVDDLYRETHGIPGRLLAELPKLNHYQNRQQRRWGLWLGLAIVVAATALAVKALLPEDMLALSDSASPATKPDTNETAIESAKGPSVVVAPESQPPAAPPPVAQPQAEPTQTPKEATPQAVANETAPAAPIPEPEIAPSATPLSPGAANIVPAPAVSPLPPATPSETAKPALPVSVGQPAEVATGPQADATQPAPVNATPSRDAGSQIQSGANPLPASEKNPVVSKAAKTAPAGSGTGWIMAQPAKNYTLQVMTLSTKDAAQRFMKKYADYGEGLNFYPVNKNGQEKFVVIFGSFESATEARQYKEVMPAEFKQALEKSFKAVQQEARR